MENLELNANAYLPLRDVVFSTLREAILRGDLKPGERLMELQLAAKLGVSRTPIREAIRMLQQEGLAVTIPRKGAQVAAMTEKDVADVLLIREALEILAAQIACDNISAECLDALEENVKEFEKALKTTDIKQIVQTDMDFHDMIYNSAGNPTLVAILNNLREQMYRYRFEYIKDSSQHERLVEEHKIIYQSILNKDKETAAAAARTHIDNQKKAIIRQIRLDRKNGRKL